MTAIADFGAIIFAKNLERVAQFYEVLVPMQRVHTARDHIILDSGRLQLTIHATPKHIADNTPISDPPVARETTPIKLFFQVKSLKVIRTQIVSLGGKLVPESREWEARGIRACDGVDPEGNVVQFRERAVDEIF